MVAAGCSSERCDVGWSKPKSHISNWVLLEKSASTAPAFVPVANRDEAVPGAHAKVAVRGISRSLAIVGGKNVYSLLLRKTFELRDHELGKLQLQDSQFL